MGTDINDLFGGAVSDGELQADSMHILTGGEIGKQINVAFGGIDVADVSSDEVIVLNVLLDNSVSMQSLRGAVVDGMAMVNDACRNSKQAKNIYISVVLLNDAGDGTIPIAFMPIEQAQNIDLDTFKVRGNTPLFKQSMVVLGNSMARWRDFSQNGVQARCITMIMTDGGDNASGNVTAKDVNVLVRDMLRTEEHIVMGYVCAENAQELDACRKQFQAMGLQDHCILESGTDESSVRQAFQIFSQSVSAATQNAADFQGVGGGGFTA